jgi:glucose/mannose-6-phosphate isomerase
LSSTEQLELDRETIGRIDPTDQLTDVLAIPEHLRDALWKVESAGLEPWDSPDGLVVAGMGGSAIGGHLARAILGDHASRPLITARAYGLPPWTTNETTVVCASYTGNTEETLTCYEAAGVIGARRVVVTAGGELAEMARADKVPVIPLAGGYQPRAAVAYLTVAVLEVAALAGVGPRMNSEIDVAADHLEELVIEWGPDGVDAGEAKSLARALNGTVPMIAGAGLTTPIAYRWKTQINENAKSPAYAQELPELDHNEIEGWTSLGEFGRFSAVFLDDDDTHPRVKERMELTSRLIRPGAAGVHHVRSRGRTTVERVFSLVLLGDLVSLYLAVLRGVDPEPVELLSALKAELGRKAETPARD